MYYVAAYLQQYQEYYCFSLRLFFPCPRGVFPFGKFSIWKHFLHNICQFFIFFFIYLFLFLLYWILKSTTIQKLLETMRFKRKKQISLSFFLFFFFRIIFPSFHFAIIAFHCLFFLFILNLLNASASERYSWKFFVFVYSLFSNQLFFSFIPFGFFYFDDY